MYSGRNVCFKLLEIFIRLVHELINWPKQVMFLRLFPYLYWRGIRYLATSELADLLAILTK